MMRSAFQFFSMFAAGVLTLGFITVLMPWVQGHAMPSGLHPAPSLHFESAIVGLVLGQSGVMVASPGALLLKVHFHKCVLRAPLYFLSGRQF